MNLRYALDNATLLARRGWLRPRIWLALFRAERRLGRGMATGFTASALRRPDAPALVDDRGVVSFRELSERVQSIAAGLAKRGVGPGTRVGVLCLNHRGFVYSRAAVQLLCARVIYLNTAFAGPQLAEVVQRERVDLLIHDEDLAGIVAALPPGLPRLLAWHEGPPRSDSLEGIARLGETFVRPAQQHPWEDILLTSGTTGTPRGALRKDGQRMRASRLAALESFPIQLDGSMMIVPPLFHAWGLSTLGMAAFTSNTIVLQRRFDAEATLAAVARWKPQLLVAVPTMLQRILELGPEVHRRHDTSSLRIVAASGSLLPGGLATRWMDAFGENLFNFYGSTELGLLSCATPAQLRSSPLTAGPVNPGVEIRIADASGQPLPVGSTGRLLARSVLTVNGYSDGTNRPAVEGYLVTGDLAHVDERGWLYVDGREDDMIVSGGENVYPAEVENLLSDHPSVLEVAVVGVPDHEFGQRLKAYVVPRAGHLPEPEHLRSYVRERLARYKVPREIEIVESLPRNAAGKILRRVLTR
jgi:acyl-CoA synthetase (AMP-forming)/AMP-acid ligase II